jgi:hypothetical protein
MAWVSSFCTCEITSAGSKRRSVASSLRIERFVGRGWEFSSSAAVRRMNCKANFVCFNEHTEEDFSIFKPPFVAGVVE